MTIFGEPKVPGHINRLKERVKTRDDESAVKLDRVYHDYEDRLTRAENKLQSDLDGHALSAEAAISELSNRGEQVTAAVSDESIGESAITNATFLDDKQSTE